MVVSGAKTNSNRRKPLPVTRKAMKASPRKPPCAAKPAETKPVAPNSKNNAPQPSEGCGGASASQGPSHCHSSPRNPMASPIRKTQAMMPPPASSNSAAWARLPSAAAAPISNRHGSGHSHQRAPVINNTGKGAALPCGQAWSSRNPSSSPCHGNSKPSAAQSSARRANFNAPKSGPM